MAAAIGSTVHAFIIEVAGTLPCCSYSSAPARAVIFETFVACHITSGGHHPLNICPGIHHTCTTVLPPPASLVSASHLPSR
jgi:hypothetical protein